MRFSVSLFTAALVALANAASPAGFSPSVNKTLIVRYGNTTITPNQTLARELVSHQPAVTLNGTYNGTYILALIDLSIDGNQARKATNLTTLVPGLQANRTTRLHWLQGGVKHSSNGSFIIPNNTAVAPYAGPQPPAGDIAHTYVFYLFSQSNSSTSSNITLTGINAGRNYTSASTPARYDFNVTALVATYGTPLAANYIRVQNVNGTSSTNGTAGGNRTSSTTTTSAPTAGATNPSVSSTSSSSSRAAAATHFAAAGLMGLVGAVVFL